MQYTATTFIVQGQTFINKRVFITISQRHLVTTLTILWYDYLLEKSLRAGCAVENAAQAAVHSREEPISQAPVVAKKFAAMFPAASNWLNRLGLDWVTCVPVPVIVPSLLPDSARPTRMS